jgi:hypothetical protein
MSRHVLICVLIVIVAGLVSPRTSTAVDDAGPSLLTETPRFIKAYRLEMVVRAAANQAKAFIDRGVSDGKISRSIGDCIESRAFSYERLMTMTASTVSMHFRDAAELKDVNDFLESPAGTKVLNQAANLFQRGSLSEAEGPAALSPEEVEKLRVFRASAAGRQFFSFATAFPASLKNFNSGPEAEQTISECSARG